MLRKRAPFPFAGLLAFVIALATLAVEFALIAVPIKLTGPNDPVGASSNERRAAEDHHRAVRFQVGTAVLGIGSGLSGWAALIAVRRRHADRALAAAAAVCCLTSVVVWLALAVMSCVNSDAWDSNERKPALTVDYDWHSSH